MNRQMTLEDLYCSQTIKPDVEQLVSDVAIFEENPPKNVTDLQHLVVKLRSHLENFNQHLNELKYLQTVDQRRNQE